MLTSSGRVTSIARLCLSWAEHRGAIEATPRGRGSVAAGVAGSEGSGGRSPAGSLGLVERNAYTPDPEAHANLTAHLARFDR